MMLGLILTAAVTTMHPNPPACDRNGTTQTAMTACAAYDLAREQAKLDLAYRGLLQRTKDPTALRNIRTAENAWKAYRDAYLNAAYPLPDKQQAYGSIYPMNVARLQIQLIARQITALNALADLYKDQ